MILYHKERGLCDYTTFKLGFPAFSFKWDRVIGSYEMGDNLPEHVFYFSFPTIFSYVWTLDCKYTKIEIRILGFGFAWIDQHGY
jgi:hypothetical protein